MLDEIRSVRLIRQISSLMGFTLVEVRLHRPFQCHKDWSLSADEIINHISFYFKRKFQRLFYTFLYKVCNYKTINVKRLNQYDFQELTLDPSHLID